MTEPKKRRNRKSNHTHQVDFWSWDNNRLLSKIEIDNNTGCHCWQGAYGPHGALFGAKKQGRPQMTQPTRLLWRALNPGKTLQGFEILHRCKNNLCLNPEHWIVSEIGMKPQGRRGKYRE